MGSIYNTGTIGNITGSFNSGTPQGGDASGRRADIGVMTALAEELHAMTEVFERTGTCRRVQLEDGTRVREATFRTRRGQLTAVLTEALARGQREAAIGFANLRRHYAPPVVAFVGIAGGINDFVAIGDVVVADQVIYYDEYREGPTGTFRRGEASAVPPGIAIVLDSLFSAHRGWFQQEARRPDGGTERFAVVRGPIGSGSGVITHAGSEVREFLLRFNERTLAVETEAGGVVAAFRNGYRPGSDLLGWLVIRGISDKADEAKRAGYHAIAAAHAAQVFELLVQHL